MVKDISHKIHTLNTMEVCTLFVTPEGLCGTGGGGGGGGGAPR
jgi:hypothetical protein